MAEILLKQLLERSTGDASQRLVSEDALAGSLVGRDADRRGRDQRAVQLQRLGQSSLGLLALGNVFEHAVNPVHFSIGGPVYRGIDRRINGCAILLLQTELVIDDGPLWQQASYKQLPFAWVHIKVSHPDFLEFLH